MKIIKWLTCDQIAPLIKKKRFTQCKGDHVDGFMKVKLV